MRKIFPRIMALMMIAALMSAVLAGCGNSKFSTTSLGNKTTIKVKEASDGDTGIGPYVSVGKNKTAAVTSELESGQLRIDFVEAIDMRTDPDEAENYIDGDIIETVTVGPGDSVEVALPEGDYSYQFTAVGDTSGTVTINIG